MHHYLKAILLKATQALTQVFQLYAKSRTTATPTGKGHVACILGIIYKFSFTAIEGMGAVITTATLLHLLTLNYDNQLAHFTMP